MDDHPYDQADLRCISQQHRGEPIVEIRTIRDPTEWLGSRIFLRSPHICSYAYTYRCRITDKATQHAARQVYASMRFRHSTERLKACCGSRCGGMGVRFQIQAPLSSKDPGFTLARFGTYAVHGICDNAKGLHIKYLPIFPWNPVTRRWGESAIP